jgi:hypothetical protein
MRNLRKKSRDAVLLASDLEAGLFFAMGMNPSEGGPYSDDIRQPQLYCNAASQSPMQSASLHVGIPVVMIETRTRARCFPRLRAA